MIVVLFYRSARKGQDAAFRQLWLTVVLSFACYIPVVLHIGVPLTALMMLVRGDAQVMGTELSAGAGASISGIAGIGHMLTGIGIVLLLTSLKKQAKN